MRHAKAMTGEGRRIAIDRLQHPLDGRGMGSPRIVGDRGGSRRQVVGVSTSAKTRSTRSDDPVRSPRKVRNRPARPSTRPASSRPRVRPAARAIVGSSTVASNARRQASDRARAQASIASRSCSRRGRSVGEWLVKSWPPWAGGVAIEASGWRPAPARAPRRGDR